MPLAARITTDRTAASKRPAMRSAPHHPSITPISSLSTNPILNREPACACGGSCPKCQGAQTIQPKFTIGAPTDKYEQEADRVADQVMRMPEPQVQRQSITDEEEVQAKPLNGIVQRQAETEAKEEGALQTKPAPGRAPAASARTLATIHALQGGGQPLPQATRNFFESRMGYEFSNVRIHSNGRAAEAAQSINARAFTLGRDVVFNRGEYSPNSHEGQRLLAHELTHTIQQQGSASAGHVQRTISVNDEASTTPPHTQNNGALVASLFNQLCPDITWQLNGNTIEPSNSTGCNAAALQRGTTPTACECACHFTNTAGPHVNIEINQTDNDTVRTGTNPDAFRVRLTGQAASGIRGIQGNAPAAGTSLRNIQDPAWVILGHELCGHAKTTFALNPSSTATLFHQMSQDWDQTAVDIENRIRQEHSAARGTNLGIRVGEFEDIDGDIHAGSLVRLPRAMSLAALLQELDVPVRYKYPRCVRQDFFYPCTTIPSAEADMRQIKIVNRVMITHNGNQAVPWSCRNNSFSQGTHFNIEGIFWHRSVTGETKQSIADQWGVSVSAMNRANRLFNNGVDVIPTSQALAVGTMVVIPYKAAPGSTRYFLRVNTGPC